MERYCLTLDLKRNLEFIEKYIEYHQNVWPEILRSICDAGIINMEIYHIDTRLFMIMDVNENFSFSEKAKSDAENSKVQEWESLMDQYQQRLPFAKPNEKWVLMNRIFSLDNK